MRRALPSLAALWLAAIAVISVGPAPAGAFKAGEAFVEGLGKTAAAVGEAERRAEGAEQGKGAVERELDEGVRKVEGQVTEKAADLVEKGVAKGGRKLWSLIEKSKKYGKTARKLAKRWGPAAKRGLRMAGPAGRVVDAWDAGTAVGGAIYKYGVGPMIDGYFRRKGRRQQEQLEEEIREIRKEAELRRKVDAQMAAQEKLARELAEEERRLEGPDRAASGDSRGSPPDAATAGKSGAWSTGSGNLASGGLLGNAGGSSNLATALNVLEKVAADPNLMGGAREERPTTPPATASERPAAEPAEPRRQQPGNSYATRSGGVGQIPGIGAMPAGCGSPACDDALEVVGPKTERTLARLQAGGLSISQMQALSRETNDSVIEAMEICVANETVPACKAQLQQLLGNMRSLRRSLE